LQEKTSASSETAIVATPDDSTIPDNVLTDDLLDQTGIEYIAPEPVQGLVKRWLARAVSLARRVIRAPIDAVRKLMGKGKK
jgi:hypothetical protein